jgi:hypothetical protein
MKVYVAGSSGEIDRVKRVMATLRSRGYEITHDWTGEVEAARAANYSDSTYPTDMRFACASADYCGVANADVVVLLLPKTTTSRGMWVEFGIALGHEPSPAIFVVGDALQSIFCELADEIVEDEESLIDRLSGMLA